MSYNNERGFLPGCNCCVTVPQDKWYSVEKFGKVSGIVQPGLHFVGLDCCACCITFRSISSRVLQKAVYVRTKTKDNVFVGIKVDVQYSVVPDRAQDAMYKLARVEQQIDAYVSDVVRSHIPSFQLDEAFEKKDEVSNAVQERLAAEMAEYGFQIHKALVTELEPAQEVMDSMNEINKQKRLRDAAIMAAEADKIKLVKNAEAQADSAFLQGQGIARQRAAIIDGLRDSITHGTQDTLNTDKITELLLVTQYFETLRDIAQSSNRQTVFIPSSAGGVREIANEVRQGLKRAGDISM